MFRREQATWPVHQTDLWFRPRQNLAHHRYRTTLERLRINDVVSGRSKTKHYVDVSRSHPDRRVIIKWKAYVTEINTQVVREETRTKRHTSFIKPKDRIAGKWTLRCSIKPATFPTKTRGIRKSNFGVKKDKLWVEWYGRPWDPTGQVNVNDDRYFTRGYGKQTLIRLRDYQACALGSTTRAKEKWET